MQSLYVNLKESLRDVLGFEFELDKNSQKIEILESYYFFFVSDLPSLPLPIIVLERSGA